MTGASHWRSRLVDALKLEGISMRSASVNAGLGAGYVHSILFDGKDPSLSNFEVICSKNGLNFLEILGGASPKNNIASQPLTISHADASPFQAAGLRSFFEYRYLGIPEATNGAFGAHVIRAIPGDASAQEWHTHTLDFQLVYVTKGWVEFEYEGHGKVMLREGSSVLQPPGIVHREVRHSDDMELLEITSPAEFKTQDAEPPNA